MKPWLQRQLRPVGASDARLVVVLDPDSLLAAGDLEPWGRVVESGDWYELRRAYEREGGRRPLTADRLVLLVHAAAYLERRDLPFDLDRDAVVVRVRIPVPPEFRRVLLDLQDDLAERAVAALSAPRYGGLDGLLGDLWGVSLGSGDEARELEAVVGLRSDPTVPESLWPLLEPRLKSEVARALTASPPDAQPLQSAWEAFLQDPGSEHAGTFNRVGARLMPIFHLGLLRPARRGQVDLPDWTAAGVADIGAAELAVSLLDARPEGAPPGDLAKWVRLAEWWAQVRTATALLGADPDGIRQRAWTTWAEFDIAFGEWLRASYGGLLLSSAALPPTVDRIAGFLAGRLRRNDAKRVLLIVLDGMGLSQWAMLQRHAGLRVIQAHACLAMIPTLTPISRQAIFRGALPMYFPATIESTDTDDRGWAAFWTQQGLPAKEVRYSLMSGANVEPIPLHGGLTAVGVVIQAIDKMLHGSNVLGDAQLAASVRAWLDRGYLRDLVAEAVWAGYEVWLASDHGNLETTPLGQAPEGLAVETAGLRVRLYPSVELREGSRLRDGGIAWDPPGLPDGWRYSLFPPGRGAYFSGEVRVTHGGLSMDEVIVPLVRVAP